MRKQQRLVVCLDGTWNNRDDATNVLHHFTLALKDEPPGVGPVTQTKYYDQGVGTGVLDSITGGGFGFGLEKNVREACDWLIEHYHDAEEGVPADEIYIFGFSRGAYTARSLVGFIATYGLLRRGAPLSVNQLWENYCILGRQREKRSSIWDKIFGKPPKVLARINDLVVDPWRIEGFEQRRATNKLDGDNAAAARKNSRVPGQLVEEMSVEEQLLVRWSRRVRIRYLGVYDTVGAMGIDALAIPGLRSKLAMHHNMRPPTLIQNCRHALAVDEHRSSFSHTPFLAFIGHGSNDDDDNQRADLSRRDAATYWRRQRAMWWRKIEQRWFAGAHSNIGGGYPDNVLAQRPLEWLLEGACRAGLQCESFTCVAPETMPGLRDSYSEFAKPLWTDIIRGKRWYRCIDPEPEVRASLEMNADAARLAAGFSLHSINEQVDESVLGWFGGEYQPPNVVAYARRKWRAVAETAAARRKRADAVTHQRPSRKLQQTADAAEARAKRLKEIADQEPRHPWLGARVAPHALLVWWAAFAAVGLGSTYELFAASETWLPVWLLGTAALVCALIDWGESRANFLLALREYSARRRAFLDTAYWARALAFVLFVFGAIGMLGNLCFRGWHASRVADVWGETLMLLKHGWLVPVAAGLGVVVASLLDRAPAERRKAMGIGVLCGVAIAYAIVPVVMFGAHLGAVILTPAFGPPPTVLPTGGPPAPEARTAGLLLLLQFSLACFLNSLSWAGAPMARANLVSIVPLQIRWSRAGVRACLEGWWQRLVCRWDARDQNPVSGPAGYALRRTLREALWRDLFGFIPLCGAVLIYGLWFAAEVAQWHWLDTRIAGAPLWLGVPLAAVVADLVEGCCHLRYLALHERGRLDPPRALTLASFSATLVKFAALIPALLVILSGGAVVSWNVAQLGDLAGWRGSAALLISSVAALLFLAITIGSVAMRLSSRLPHPRP